MAEELSNKTQHSPPVQENDSQKHETNKKLTSPSPLVQNVVDDGAGQKDTGDSTDKDALLAKVVVEKRFALIRAWEESEKTKADNRAHKKLSAVGLWEDGKKASVEAQLKKIEQDMERKKVEYVEKMKNKVAEIHRSAEEKRAIVKAKRMEEFVDLEDTAEKLRSLAETPRKLFSCFSL